MGRRSSWASVSLPSPPIRRATPEEREATAAMVADMLAKRERYAAIHAERKARETPEQREAKAARDYIRWLRRQLRRAADAARWERIAAALDVHGWQYAGAKAKADPIRERVRERTAEAYARAAAGCLVCATFIADESADDLYREAFNEPAAPVRQ